MSLFKAVETDWVKINHLFHQALECTKEERAEFLARNCGGDVALEQEIRSLIATYEEDEQFMESPVLKENIARFIGSWQARIGLSLAGPGFNTGATLETDALDPMIGQVLDGKYRIEQLRGRGGMGIVYRATHLGTGRVSAVKVMAPAIAGRIEFIERFKREAKAIGMLNHPNIVDVTDFGLTYVFGQQIAYLVMELLEGQTLADRISEKGKLSLPETVAILKQVASAVDEAHRAGVLHLDLKPDNIWLKAGAGINVKVLDFGLSDLHDCLQVVDAPPADASAVDRPELPVDLPSLSPRPFFSVTEADTLIADPSQKKDRSVEMWRESRDTGSTDNTRGWTLMSRCGAVMGTPVYMSPEQRRGERLTPLSDIYSIGVIAYRMLSGEVPFGGTLPELLNLPDDAKPAPLSVGRSRSMRRSRGVGIPPGVDDAIRNALSHIPSTRPREAGAFVFQLELETGKGDWIRKQACALYKRDRLRWISLGAFAPFPSMLAGLALLVGAFLLPSTTEIPTFLLGVALWLGMTFFTLLGQASTIAASSLFVDEKLGNKESRTGLWSILGTVRGQTLSLGIGIVEASVGRLRHIISRRRPSLGDLPMVAFVASSTVEELRPELGDPTAMERAETLFSRVRRIAQRYFPKRILLFGLTLAAWELLLASIASISDDGRSGGPFDPALFLVLLIASSLVVFTLNLRSSIEQGLLFWSARKVGGEIEAPAPPSDNLRARRMLPRFAWSTGTSLILVAAMLVGGQIVKYSAMPFLLERGATDTARAFNISGAPAPGWSDANPVWVASDPRSLNFMLETGNHPDARIKLPSVYGDVTATPLMAAIIGRSQSGIRYLAARGADVNAQDSKNRTPLMLAAIYFPEAIDQLIRAGANPQIRTSQGTLLQVAARYQWMFFRTPREMRPENNAVQALLDRGAGVDERDADGRTPLMLVGLEKRPPFAIIRTAETLIAAGADRAAVDNNGLTALDHARRNNSKPLIDFLSNKTKTVNLVDEVLEDDPKTRIR